MYNATSLSQGVVINRTPSPYQQTRMYVYGICEWGPNAATSEMCRRLYPDWPPIRSVANRGVGSANVQRA